jgi:HAMP domain-containing protein
VNAEPTTTLYIVNMLYRIEDETTRNDVANRVASKLNLSPEQVYKLLSRPPGRMIKPATLERAEVIANAFIGVGVPVEVVKAEQPDAPAFFETPEPVQEAARAAWETPAPQAPVLLETAPAAAQPVAVTPVAAAEPEVRDAPPAPQRPRGSLAAKVLSVTVLPLLIVGLSLIAYLQTQLTQESARLEAQNAQQIVQIAVGALGTQTSTAELAQIVRSPIAFVNFTDAQGNKVFFAKDTKNRAAIQSALTQLETAQPTEVQSGAAMGVMSVPELPNNAFRVQAVGILTDGTTTYTKFADGSSATVIPATAKQMATAEFGLESQGFQLTQQLVNTVGFIMLAIAIVTLISQVFARQLIDPIVRLTRTADRLSLGELDLPVSADTNDEMGDLAEALERMRLSLKSAIERLRRRR